MLGKNIRLGKICGNDGKAMLVAADHGLMLGPIKGVENLEATLKKIIAGGCDGILISPGQAMRISHLFHGKDAPAMLVRGDYISGFRSHTYTLPNEFLQEYRIISPKKALSLGATAMVVYYLLGRPDDPFDDETTNIRIISKMAEESQQCGLPFIIEPMPYGSRVTGSNYADLLRIGIRVAEEIGADAIKIPYSGSSESFKKIVDSVDIPVFILGGAKSKTYRDACELVEDALEVGAHGTVFGRQILQAEDPGKLASYLMQIVHSGMSVKDVFAHKVEAPSKLQINQLKCTGCNICSMACSMSHAGAQHPNYFAINVESCFPKNLKNSVCIQCGKCITACPKGAISYNTKLGNLQVDTVKCNLCTEQSLGNGDLLCITSCPSNVIKAPINLSRDPNDLPYSQSIPLMCDFCGGLPECIEMCPNDAIQIKNLTEEEITRLQT